MENRFDSKLGNGGSTGTMNPPATPMSSQTSTLLQQAQQQAGNVAEQAKQQVTSRLESQKGRAAESLQNIAEALHQAGQHLREQGQAPIGDCMDWAAREAEQITHYMQEKHVDQFVDDVERFARRNPAVFLGGAFALGFLAARFLKSSSPNGSEFRSETAALSPPESRMPGWNAPGSSAPTSETRGWDTPPSNTPGWSAPSSSMPPASTPGATSGASSKPNWSPPSSTIEKPSTPASNTPASTMGTPSAPASSKPASTIGTSSAPASGMPGSTSKSSTKPDTRPTATSPAPEDSHADEDE